jgi:amino acid adenylation domain-containing protein
VHLSTIFHSAWGILLSRYCGGNDVVFGETRACRKGSVEGAGTILGCCINTVPLRFRIRPGALLKDVLTQVHEDRAAVRPHEQTPPGKIRGWSQVTGGRPLFDSLIVYDHVGLTALMRSRHPDRPDREYAVLSHTHFPLVFEVQGEEGVLRLTWAALQFTPGAAERMLSHLRTILTAMAEGGGRRVAQIPMLAEDEERQILVEWNDTRSAGSTRPRCVHELIEIQAGVTPEAVAVSCGEEKWTYRDLNHRADDLARRLAALGVGPEVVVGIALERSCEMLMCLLAVLKSGGAYLPLDPSLPGERLRCILDDARPSHVLTSKSLSTLFSGKSVTLLFPEENPGAGADATLRPPARPGPGNAAYVIYTSGSTGRPKGTVVLHRGLTNYLLWCTEAYDVGRGSGSLVHTPLAFDLTVTGLYAPLLCGRTVHLLPESSTPEDLPRALLDHADVSLVKITPAHVDLLAGLMPPGTGASLSPRFVIGGESLRWDVAARMQTIAPGAELFNEYGPTETTVGCIAYRIPQEARGSGPVPIGRPINNTRIYILDTEMRPVPVGVTGEIWIGGAGVARGYLNRDALTAERFVRDPFSADEDSRLYRSGDLGRYLPDGNIEYLGRTDDQVKIRGYRIEPGEIVSVLLSHSGVRDAAVIPRAIAGGETRLEAYIVPAGAHSPGGDELRSHVRRSLPDYMVPSVFVRVSALPINARGKVDRSALLDRGIARVHESDDVEGLPTPAEDAMRRIWEDLLAVKGIAPADNFFDIGGHSLAAMQLVSRIRARWNVELRISDVFNAPTLAALSSAVERRVLEEVERMPDEEPRRSRNADLFTAGEQSNA